MVNQITIDENNVITCCSIGGYIGGIDVENIPDEVMENPGKWKFIDGGFFPNEDYIEETPCSLKEEYIEKSKTALAEWLENNPYLHTDGKYYACTAEKQSLLNSNLASYERAKAIGVEYPLKWNSTGDECTEWGYTELLTLSLSIAAYVAPKVSKQQSIEIQINACETTEDVYNVVINYDE